MYVIKISSSKKSIFGGAYETQEEAQKKVDKVTKKYPQANCKIIETDKKYIDLVNEGLW